ncbi:unnamed protein product [Adineta ricciae]|uniref:Uncharacterized protein n=1 Tax=Adineta ricciae TaxID=249248 RepID=A0A814ZCK3_ADIRI|nr:unnamed protein product [Adineta ricciae]CAF1242281.1 unnamed protein product [Adineta ricciae]
MSVEKKPCIKCGCKNWVLLCDGCRRFYCVEHVLEHRTELSTQLNGIEQEYENLKQLFKPHEKHQEHPLLSQIDVWEHDAILKIQYSAQTARDELRQLLNEYNNRMKTVLQQFSQQLRDGRQENDFTETELNQWKEQLQTIRQQFEAPADIELLQDKQTVPIYFMKVARKQAATLFSPSPILEMTTASCSEIENVRSSYGDEFDEPQSTMTDTNDDLIPQRTCLEIHEATTILKETEIETNHEQQVLPDPTKSQHLVILHLCPTNQSQIIEILPKLTKHPIELFNQTDDYLNKLQSMERTTVFVDLTNSSPNERISLLNKLSQFDSISLVYIQGKSFEDDEDRSHVFRRYPKIRAMFENVQRLLVQWSLDTINEYQNAGDRYIEQCDQVRARYCFEEGIKLYEYLSVFLSDKRRLR